LSKETGVHSKGIWKITGLERNKITVEGGKIMNCEVCNGTGKVLNHLGGFITIDTCSNCGGRGEVCASKSSCPIKGVLYHPTITFSRMEAQRREKERSKYGIDGI
jgi:DnaJ-class molecular chaperone